MIFLAEATTEYSYQSIGWLVVGIAAICVAANQIGDFIARFRTPEGKPPNGEIAQRIENAVSRIERSEREITDLRTELAKDRHNLEIHMSARSKTLFEKMDAQNATSEDSRERLHQRVNSVMENTAETKGQMQAFTQAFDNFTKIVVEIARRTQ